MATQLRGITIPIKQVMVLGIRMSPDMPLGPRGGVITLAAAEGPEEVTSEVLEASLPPTRKKAGWPRS